MHNPHKILFVVNPIAGGNEKKNWEEIVRDAFKELPFTIEFFIQTGKDDKPKIKKHIERFCPAKVVAVGGDGTIKLVAEIIKETSITLGIIPGGSANGLAKELGIPADVPGAVSIITNGIAQGLDAIKINEEELSFHLSDVGLNAMLVKYFEDSEGRGMWGYGKSLCRMLWNKKKMRVTITTDAGIIKRKAYMVTIANAEKFGTGAIINPGGNALDGIFEIVVVRKINFIEIIKAITARRKFDSQKIEVLKTRKAELCFQRPAPFQIDGEYRGETANIAARILPQIIQVMLPVTNLA